MLYFLLQLLLSISAIILSLLVCGFGTLLLVKILGQIQDEYIEICKTRKFKAEYIKLPPMATVNFDTGKHYNDDED